MWRHHPRRAHPHPDALPSPTRRHCLPSLCASGPWHTTGQRATRAASNEHQPRPMGSVASTLVWERHTCSWVRGYLTSEKQPSCTWWCDHCPHPICGREQPRGPSTQSIQLFTSPACDGFSDWANQITLLLFAQARTSKNQARSLLDLADLQQRCFSYSLGRR